MEWMVWVKFSKNGNDKLSLYFFNMYFSLTEVKMLHIYISAKPLLKAINTLPKNNLKEQ